ncbi:MAG: hypothetical protein MOIL_00090 [Candidatus Methanolliviera sp. GoM_oil]|nr:MAG: hypothetical protein MOIL_00090 [Candidatus Methanolliviera sp. GoM_oil]VUT24021.1 MAG: hypothetical protein MASP_00297 [Candidatus Methanolliviera sp. GoM_asphalt]
MEEIKKKYKCKYCGEEFDTPLELARHVRAKHKRAKAREKIDAKRTAPLEEIAKAIEAIGILKGLQQVSPHLNEGEKKILADVSKRMETLVMYVQRSK